MQEVTTSPHFLVLGKTQATKKGDHILLSASIEGEKSSFQIFSDWFNSRANARMIFKLGKLITDLAGEFHGSSTLHKSSLLFKELMKGFALGYFFNKCSAVFYPAQGESWTKKISNGFELSAATFLNISIFASIFDQTVKRWAGPAGSVSTLGSNSVKLYDTIFYKMAAATSEKEKSKLRFTLLLQITAVAISFLTLLSMALKAPVLPLAVLYTLAIVSTNLKLFSSFREYTQRTTTVVI